ncbi:MULTISPECIES: DUF134 domain-containing protein [Clostridium]|uniref:UPF0251 protein H9637_09285 n=1 Tax=Clostridium faecium TaxID=2762223 RepID=A0ABR8YSM5_9CLOT|nr:MULTISPECIES: DUF134 domain-containing protein [Clostridium]MBD8047224.1 DUF134 domain-containing protein [Clostridium faecium]MDU1348394.1 DUF134 domain-containing protein [Clostridium argentinense]
MARPIKLRKVQFKPRKTYFVPCPKKHCHSTYKTDEIKLKFEEVEAMRLKDIRGLSQEDAAKEMEVSRQTFQNIIDEARKKVALAIINGYSIAIEGGNYTKHICKFKCNSCHSEYELAYEKTKTNCINCNSEKIICKNKNICNMKCSKA